MNRWWEDHGTKILGSLIAGVAAFQVAMPQLQDLITKKEYVLLQIATSVALAVLGSLTIKRGFTNSATADDGSQSGT